MKKLRYRIEAFLSHLVYHLFKMIPLGAASAVGGFVARHIGPLTGVHKVAERNLIRVMPEFSGQERAEILLRMWDNLGRVFCEYAHLNNPKMNERVEEVHGAEHLQEALNSGRPVIVVAGHLGNWELPPVIAAKRDMPLHLLYRAANNPAVDALIAEVRRPYTLGLHDKGRRAAKALLKAMQAREPVAMLIDQKTNNGIAVPFFGEAAMTSDVLAHLVQKHHPIVLPSRCVRLKGCAFRVEVYPPMRFDLSEDAHANRRMIMAQLHAVLEAWIREDPAQWFWVHKRWPFSKKKD